MSLKTWLSASRSISILHALPTSSLSGFCSISSGSPHCNSAFPCLVIHLWSAVSTPEDSMTSSGTLAVQALCISVTTVTCGPLSSGTVRNVGFEISSGPLRRDVLTHMPAEYRRRSERKGYVVWGARPSCRRRPEAREVHQKLSRGRKRDQSCERDSY
ncbi:hypothetical protein FB451DRAFT_198088 [Mycena latifolia]|nr:hypothetical protein FB451DRAFT_198088 [Mycena latifolia]